MFSLGGLLMIVLVVAIIPIGNKVKEHSSRIKELEKGIKKPGVRK